MGKSGAWVVGQTRLFLVPLLSGDLGHSIQPFLVSECCPERAELSFCMFPSTGLQGEPTQKADKVSDLLEASRCWGTHYLCILQTALVGLSESFTLCWTDFRRPLLLTLFFPWDLLNVTNSFTRMLCKDTSLSSVTSLEARPPGRAAHNSYLVQGHFSPILAPSLQGLSLPSLGIFSASQTNFNLLPR